MLDRTGRALVSKNRNCSAVGGRTGAESSADKTAHNSRRIIFGPYRGGSASNVGTGFGIPNELYDKVRADVKQVWNIAGPRTSIDHDHCSPLRRFQTQEFVFTFHDRSTTRTDVRISTEGMGWNA